MRLPNAPYSSVQAVTDHNTIVAMRVTVFIYIVLIIETAFCGYNNERTQNWPRHFDGLKRFILRNRHKRAIFKLRERVVGGIAATENKFPWVVYFHAISKKRKNGSEEFGSVTNFCGGSLIHPR